MGRRALRKIDPQLDLSRHLQTLDELPCPWDAAAWFGRSAPLEIEIGSGKGLFLEQAAAATPEHDFVGIEVARKYARFAAARLAKRQLPNALMICGDGLRWMSEFLAAEGAVAVHVYFPDPWWKKRHHKRRIMTASLLADIQRVLAPRGRLHFWTDVEEYYHQSVDLIAATTTLEGPCEVPVHSPEHDRDYRTHFERRMRLLDKPVFRAEYIKPA